jgi:hypothetical protein
MLKLKILLIARIMVSSSANRLKLLNSLKLMLTVYVI